MTTHTHVIDPTPLLPVTLAPGSTAEVVLPVREDLSARAGRTTLTLTMLLEESAFGDQVQLTLNQTPLKPHITVSSQGHAPRAVGKNTYAADVDPATLISGDNLLTLSVAPIEPRKSPPLLSQLRLHVKRAPV